MRDGTALGGTSPLTIVVRGDGCSTTRGPSVIRAVEVAARRCFRIAGRAI